LFPNEKRRFRKLPSSSNSKILIHADSPLNVVSESAIVVSTNFSKVTMEKRKKQAEEPIYLKRI
jgi:hypothetical protein